MLFNKFGTVFVIIKSTGSVDLIMTKNVPKSFQASTLQPVTVLELLNRPTVLLMKHSFTSQFTD